jgi:hypothetical protein
MLFNDIDDSICKATNFSMTPLPLLILSFNFQLNFKFMFLKKPLKIICNLTAIGYSVNNPQMIIA